MTLIRYALAGLTVAAIYTQAGATAAPLAFTPSVVRSVHDGDTLTLTTGEKVRLLQIDTAELSPRECGGTQGRDKARELLPPGTKVRLEAEPALGNRDRFGRLLRYVHRGRLNVNVRLVWVGAGAPYFYRGQRGRYSARLLSAARLAQRDPRGLWAGCIAALDPERALTTRFRP